MNTFAKSEIFTATEVVRNFSAILGDLPSKKRAVILKNGHFEAVLLSMAEYERLAEAVRLLEAIYSQKKELKGGE